MQNFELSVYDIAGKKLIQQRFSTSTLQLNVSQLQSGIYILEVKDKSGFALRKKLVKQ